MYCPCKAEILWTDEQRLSEVIVSLHPHKKFIPEWVKGKTWIVRKGMGFFRSILKQETQECICATELNKEANHGEV